MPNTLMKSSYVQKPINKIASSKVVIDIDDLPEGKLVEKSSNMVTVTDNSNDQNYGDTSLSKSQQKSSDTTGAASK